MTSTIIKIDDSIRAKGILKLNVKGCTVLKNIDTKYELLADTNVKIGDSTIVVINIIKISKIIFTEKRKYMVVKMPLPSVNIGKYNHQYFLNRKKYNSESKYYFISKKDFLAEEKLNIKCADKDLHCQEFIKIVSYDCYLICKKAVIEIIHVEGESLKNIENLINKAKVGDVLVFENIKASNEMNKTKITLNSIFFSISEL